MGREFEQKYVATPEALSKLHAHFPELQPITMETAYFDAVDGSLSLRHWTLRQRMENGVSVCALKTPLPDGARGEWEVECDCLADAIPRLVDVGAPEELTRLTANGIRQVCAARFTRLAGLITLERATVELALDQGTLLGGGLESPLSEVEVELKSGADEAAVAFAEALAARFGLTPERKSKYRRALELAHGR